MASKQNRALSIEEIRAIIRANPAVFAALANAGANGLEDAARIVTQALMNNPAVITAIVAAGADMTIEAASKVGLLRWLIAADVIAKTQAAVAPEILLATFHDELVPLCLNGGGALQ